MPTPTPAVRSTVLRASWLLPPFVAGAALRLFHLAPQVLDGDEIHAVRAAVSMPLAAILTTYQESDNCIPLTALFRLLLAAGVRLSEIGFRSPSIVCGLLLLALLPLGALRRLPRGTGIVFAWLLALSPLLVFYSRIARSYLPMTFCGLAAAAAFAAWWRSLRPAYAVAYVILGGLAVWLHLGAAPIVGAPFLFAALDLLWGKKEERIRRLSALAFLAGGIVLAVAAFLVPARESLLKLVAEKHQSQNVPWETIVDVLKLQAGTASRTLTILFWLVALGGLAVLVFVHREYRRLGLYTLTLAGAQLLGIRLLSPLGLANPLILDRYLLPVLPLLLLWIACALALPWRPLASWGRTGIVFQGLLATVFLLLFVVRGPLADRTLWASSFMHHNDFLGFYAPRPRLVEESVPWPYQEMAKAEGRAGAVIEYPWSSFAGLRTPYLYQEVHGRPVLVSGPQRLLFDPTLALKNVVQPSAESFCASGARFLAVHLHVAREEDRIVAPEEERLGEREMRPDLRRTLHEQAETLAGSLTDLWGDPTWAAPSLRFWDLDLTCQRTEGSR